MRIFSLILCVFLCTGCQVASRQLVESSVPSLSAAPPVEVLKAAPVPEKTPFIEKQEVVSTANDCFAEAFDFMQYWLKEDAKTEFDFSFERGGSVRSSVGYSGHLLF